MPLSPGQVLNNRYRIVKLLGQGGFGAVYRAWDLNLDYPRAIKENLDTSPEAQRQFKREAQILTSLTHPNLPKVIDHFIIPGQGQYLVMDFVEGEDLQTMLQRVGRPLPEAQVLQWAGQVCDALDYLHSQNPPIIHRDIKPANIKITPQGKAMLVDFGIAKIYDPNLSTTKGARSVTSGYSPPEQYGRGGATDARSDIYALGATLYHLLTGQIPPDSVDVVMHNVPPPPPVAAINPTILLQVGAAIDKAIRLERDQRWHSSIEFKKGLFSFQSLPATPGVSGTPSGTHPAAPRPITPTYKAPLPTTPPPTSSRVRRGKGMRGTFSWNWVAIVGALVLVVCVLSIVILARLWEGLGTTATSTAPEVAGIVTMATTATTTMSLPSDTKTPIPFTAAPPPTVPSSPLPPTPPPVPTNLPSPSSTSVQPTLNSGDFSAWASNADILLFEDIASNSQLFRYVSPALKRLGLTNITDVGTDQGRLKEAMLSGSPSAQPWDLVG